MSTQMITDYPENCYWYRKQAAKPVDQEARKKAEEQRIAKANKLAAETMAKQKAEAIERNSKIDPAKLAALKAAGIELVNGRPRITRY